MLAVCNTMQAQTLVTADAAMASGFVWRGIHFTNRPVVQSDLILTTTTGRTSLSAGLWVNAEAADYRDANAIRMLPKGSRGPALTAITTWLDATVSAGAVNLTGGYADYRYPSRTGLSDAFNTGELYAAVSHHGMLSKRIQLWWDVNKIHGAYLEAAVDHEFKAGIPLIAALAAGWSLGQEENGTESAYFVRRGFAAVDGSIGMPITKGSLSIQPVIHGVLAHDAATRMISPINPDRGMKIWWSVGASWTR